MSTKTKTLKVNKRSLQGRKVKQLRQKNILPVNLYGSKIKSLSLQLSYDDFVDFYQEVGETKVLNLNIEGESKLRPVLINSVQRNPVSSNIIHADFRQVDLKEKIEADVVVELIGTSPAENKGGVVVHLLDSIKVKALPNDLPEKFELDISKLEEIGDNLGLKDLKYDSSKVEILTEDKELQLVKIDTPSKEEEKAVPAKTEDEESVEEESKEQSSESKEGDDSKKHTEDKDKSSDSQTADNQAISNKK